MGWQAYSSCLISRSASGFTSVIPLREPNVNVCLCESKENTITVPHRDWSTHIHGSSLGRTVISSLTWQNILHGLGSWVQEGDTHLLVPWAHHPGHCTLERKEKGEEYFIMVIITRFKYISTVITISTDSLSFASTFDPIWALAVLGPW